VVFTKRGIFGIQVSTCTPTPLATCTESFAVGFGHITNGLQRKARTHRKLSGGRPFQTFLLSRDFVWVFARPTRHISKLVGVRTFTKGGLVSRLRLVQLPLGRGVERFCTHEGGGTTNKRAVKSGFTIGAAVSGRRGIRGPLCRHCVGGFFCEPVRSVVG
jgi:hypothetical protein